MIDMGAKDGGNENLAWLLKLLKPGLIFFKVLMLRVKTSK